MIITISRQYGSAGQEIGQKVAEKLGIAFYDKNLIEKAAEKTGIPTEILSQGDEKAPNPFLAGYLSSPENQAFFSQSDVLRSLAEKESFVVIGRCANYALKGKADTLDLFIYAPKKIRNMRVETYLGTDDEWTVNRAIDHVDATRKNYYNHYTGAHWGRPESYNLMLDSSILGIDGTVELIVEVAKAYFNA